MGHVDKPGTIKLNPQQAAFVKEAVSSGEYASQDAVVEEALREWKERRDNFGYTLDELRRLVQEGIDSGPAVEGPTVVGNLREQIRAKIRAKLG